MASRDDDGAPSSVPSPDPATVARVVASVRRMTEEDSGLDASPGLPSAVERALGLGYAPAFLSRKTEEGVELLLASPPPGSGGSGSGSSGSGDAAGTSDGEGDAEDSDRDSDSDDGGATGAAPGRSIAEVLAMLAAKEGVPERRKPYDLPAGLRRRPNGKWEVATFYQGKKFQIGTFSSRERGEAANQVARDLLGKSEPGAARRPPLPEPQSDEQVKENVRLAKEAAMEAAAEAAATWSPRDPPVVGRGAQEGTGDDDAGDTSSADSGSVGTSADAGMVAGGGIELEGGSAGTPGSKRNEGADGSVAASSRCSPDVAGNASLNPSDDGLCTNTTPGTRDEGGEEAAPVNSKGPIIQGGWIVAPMNLEPVLSPGLRRRPNGNWDVRTTYQGKKRQIGTFSTREEGAAANAVARDLLNSDKLGRPLSDKEVYENLRMTRKAAADAASRWRAFNGGDRPDGLAAAEGTGERGREGLTSDATPGSKPRGRSGGSASNDDSVVMSTAGGDLASDSEGSHGSVSAGGCPVGTPASTKAMAGRSDGEGGGALAATSGVMPGPKNDEGADGWVDASSPRFSNVIRNAYFTLNDEHALQPKKIRKTPDNGATHTDSGGEEETISVDSRRIQGDSIAASPSNSVLSVEAPGLRRRPNGKWDVRTTFHGKKRQIGTFLTKEQGAAANAAARGVLKSEKASRPLSDANIEEYVRLARAAALAASRPLAPNVDRSVSSATDDCVGVSTSMGGPMSDRGDSDGSASADDCSVHSPAEAELEMGGLGKEGGGARPTILSDNNGGADESVASSSQCLSDVVSAPSVDGKGVEFPGGELAASLTESDSENAVSKGNTAPPPGLRRRPNGKWVVVTFYHGKKRQIGTFLTEEQGAAANVVARDLLKNEKGAHRPLPSRPLSGEQIDENIRLARKAAFEAASRLEGKAKDITASPNYSDAGEDAFPGGGGTVSLTESDSDNVLVSKETNVTLSDGEVLDRDNSSDGEKKDLVDDSDQGSEDDLSDEDLDAGGDESSSSSDDQEECSRIDEEEEEIESDDDGHDDIDENVDEEVESEAEEAEECSSSEEEGGSETDESDADEEAEESESEHSSEDESVARASIVEESECEGDENCDVAYNSDGDHCDVSFNDPLDSSDSWCAPSASLTKQCRTGAASSAMPKTASRFRQWMGRKKAPTVSITKPQPQRRRQILSSLNQERWQRNVGELKAFKERYGDTNVPCAYGTLGSFVRNTRALYKMPDHPKSWTLTDDRRQMLDEIDFEWTLPGPKTTHAHRQRARNITRAGALMTEITKCGGTIAQDERETTNPKSDLSKQLAQYVINTELMKLKPGFEKTEDLSMAYQEALLAGVTELDLFNAFEDIGTGNEVDLTSGFDFRKYPHLSLRPSQELKVFEEWLHDRKRRWRRQQKPHRLRKRKRDEDRWLEKGDHSEDFDRPKLLSGHWQSEKNFQQWLANRKVAWREQQGDPNIAETKITINVLPPGLRRRPNGKWEVVTFYHGKKRQIGTFSTREQGAVANAVARKKLKPENGVRPLPLEPLSDEQIQDNVKLARKAAFEAASRLEGEAEDEAKLAIQVGRQKLKVEKCSKQVGEENGNVKMTHDCKKKPKQMMDVDYRTCGVRQTSSGKWAVEISHKSKLRHIGTFLNQDQAALANKIVRDLLKPDGSKTDSCPEDSAAEAEEKVSLAREAALEAVSRLEVVVHDQSSLEGGISPNVGNMILKSTRKRTHEGMEKIKESPKPKKSSTAHTDLIQTKSAPPKRKPTDLPGLRQKPNGKWEVVTFYHGKKRQIGTFSLKEQGMAANTVAREKLKTEKEPLSDEQIEHNVKSARKAALAAASRLSPTSPNKEAVGSDDVPKVKAKASMGQDEPGMVALSVEQDKKAIDFKSVGVRQTLSGNWEVGFRYKGIRRNLGTFDTQEKAALANEVGRKMLGLTRGAKLSAEEIDWNVKQARKAVLDSVQKMKNENDTPPKEETMLKMLPSSVEAEGRPSLLSSRLQSENVGKSA